MNITNGHDRKSIAHKLDGLYICIYRIFNDEWIIFPHSNRTANELMQLQFRSLCGGIKQYYHFLSCFFSHPKNTALCPALKQQTLT